MIDPHPDTARRDLDAAAADAVRLAEELLLLHRRLDTAAALDPVVRATRYRLDDAAHTCRRASEELLLRLGAAGSVAAADVSDERPGVRRQYVPSGDQFS